MKWRAAVGPNSEYYLPRWLAMAAKNTAFSWNWPACLFNLFWFAWRKMWLPMFGVLGAMLVLGLVGAIPGLGQVAFLLSIGVSFVTGAFGNHLYRKQTANLVASTAALGRDLQLEALRSRGGVSVPALVVSLSVFGLLFLLAVIGAAVQQARLNELNQLNGAAPYDPNYDPAQEGGQVPTGDKPVEEDPQQDYYQP
jgi:hypothetical protein